MGGVLLPPRGVCSMSSSTKELENILLCTEIHVKEFLDRMEHLGNKIEEWVCLNGPIPKKYKAQLENIWSICND